jgi:hypothetical protein
MRHKRHAQDAFLKVHCDKRRVLDYELLHYYLDKEVLPVQRKSRATQPILAAG